MSLLVPPQFDTYGVTFWIPSQVEPTVALIGTSLPAMQQSLVSAAQRVSQLWSQVSGSVLRSSKYGSSGAFAERSTSHRPEPSSLRSDDSEAGLKSQYTELRELK